MDDKQIDQWIFGVMESQSEETPKEATERHLRLLSHFRENFSQEEMDYMTAMLKRDSGEIH